MNELRKRAIDALKRIDSIVPLGGNLSPLPEEMRQMNDMLEEMLRELLEECAKIADKEAAFGEIGHMQTAAESNWRTIVAKDIARKIRTLGAKK